MYAKKSRLAGLKILSGISVENSLRGDNDMVGEINLICLHFLDFLWKDQSLGFPQSMTMNNWRWVGNFSNFSPDNWAISSQPSTIKSISSGFLWQLSWPRLHGEFNAVYFEKNEEPQQTDGARYDSTTQQSSSETFSELKDAEYLNKVLTLQEK